jgi:hypothetical protein
LGLAQLNTGTSLTGYAAVIPSTPAQVSASTNYFDFSAVLYLSLEPTNLQDFTTIVGLGAWATGLWESIPVNGIYFRARDTEPNWYAVINKNDGSPTEIDTNVTLASTVGDNSHKTFRVVFNGTQAYFYINNVDVAPNISMTNVPANGTVYYQPGVGAYKTAGGTARSVFVDSMSMEIGDGLRNAGTYV